MRALHKSAADIDCRTYPLVNLQRAKSYRAAHNIGNRIHRSHFVEVNFFHRDVVNLRFRVRQQFKGLEGQAPGIFRQRGLLDQRTNAGPVSAMHMMMPMLFVRVFVSVIVLVNVFVLVIVLVLMLVRVLMFAMRMAVPMFGVNLSWSFQWRSVRGAAIHQHRNFGGLYATAVDPLNMQLRSQVQCLNC